jgi:Na+-driven multidrug efflux pump
MQCIALILMPISVMGNMLFQSIGKSGRATFLSSIRSGVAFIPILLLFSRMWGILGIQLAQPVADAFSALITIPFLSEFFKRLPEDS